jgi:hypothetical protein
MLPYIYDEYVRKNIIVQSSNNILHLSGLFKTLSIKSKKTIKKTAEKKAKCNILSSKGDDAKHAEFTPMIPMSFWRWRIMEPDDKSLLSFFNMADTEDIERETQNSNPSGRPEPSPLEERFARWLEITNR